MAKESQAIAQKLQDLQNTPQHPSVALLQTSQPDRASLPPHLSRTPTFTGTISEKDNHHQRRMDPLNPATGLAEPFNPTQVPAAPTKTALQSGAPRPEEATHK